MREGILELATTAMMHSISLAMSMIRRQPCHSYEAPLEKQWITLKNLFS